MAFEEQKFFLHWIKYALMDMRGLVLLGIFGVRVFCWFLLQNLCTG